MLVAENSTQKILDQHANSAEQYHLALENLQRVNQSITYLLKLVDRTRSEIDEKLNWLTHIAGGTGTETLPSPNNEHFLKVKECDDLEITKIVWMLLVKIINLIMSGYLLKAIKWP